MPAFHGDMGRRWYNSMVEGNRKGIIDYFIVTWMHQIQTSSCLLTMIKIKYIFFIWRFIKMFRGTYKLRYSESNKNMLPHAKSFHPPTLTKNIPFWQFQRLRRICTNDQEFDTESKEMYNRFKERDYSSKVLDAALMRASSIECNSLLHKKLLTAKTGQGFLFHTL